MRLYQLALREIGRRKIRTLYTASGIALSVALLVATILVGSAGQKDLLLTIARYGHSLTILPATTMDTSLQSFGIGSGHYIPEEAIPSIRTIYDAAIQTGWERMGGLVLQSGIPFGGEQQIQEAIFAPRLYEETNVLDRRVVVAGVDSVAEYQTRFWWEVDSGNLMNDPQEVMVGKVFAAITGVKVGDQIDINGQSFKVGGILRETDSPDDYMIFSTLPTVQKLFGKQGLVSLINVRAMCNYCPVGDAELAINKKVVGVRATSQREIAQAQHKIFRNVTHVILTLVGLSLLMACMAVFNMIMGTMHGRIREIGLLKVLGASRWQLMRTFAYESIALGILGGLIGYALGVSIAFGAGPWLLSGAVIELHWWEPLLAVVAAIITSLLATLLPALHASRISVATAFRAQ